MVDNKNLSDDFAQGKERLGEIGRRLGAAFGKPASEAAGGGLFAGLGNLVEQLGKLVAVHEIREPMVDLFDEPSRLLIVAEVPGVEEANLQIELQDDILLIATIKGEPNYRKELLLPRSFAQKDLSFQCRNGVLEIVLKKDKAKKARP